MSSPPRLPRKPEARTEKVEDLVALVLEGAIRVPRFQRGLKWRSEDVAKFFDSIYRGYPVGSLLFYKSKAEAESIEVGPLAIDAPEMATAWWVVDGQQRVTSLAACLARGTPLPTRPAKEDPLVLYFDSEREAFEPPPATGPLPSTWIPLPWLLDASQLQERIFQWKHAQNEDLRRVVFEAGARIRDYSIPLYLIEAEEKEVAEEIFYRTNQAGRSLNWTEIHTALFGGTGTSPSTLSELAEELTSVGMGRPEEDRLLTCLLALRGKDPTRSLDQHYDRDPEVLRNAVQEALPVLRRVLSFLRRDAKIPHLRLLPKSILLDVLTRFFHLHPEPNSRTRMLLSRWFWRTVLGGGGYDDRTLRRRGIAGVTEDEEESAQALLRLLHKERPRQFELPASFDSRADAAKITMLALAHLGPRHLESGQPIRVAELLEHEGKNAFVKILDRAGIEGSTGPANRVVHPGRKAVSSLVSSRIAEYGPEDPVLRSHGMETPAIEFLREDLKEAFLQERARFLRDEARRFADRMAAWEHSDRPSIEHLLVEAGVAL